MCTPIVIAILYLGHPPQRTQRCALRQCHPPVNERYLLKRASPMVTLNPPAVYHRNYGEIHTSYPDLIHAVGLKLPQGGPGNKRKDDSL